MDQETSQLEISKIAGNILLIFAAVVLPGTEWSIFGWIHVFLPLLIFFFLIKYGDKVGSRFILFGCTLALIVGGITQNFESLLFSFSLIPTGYVLASSGRKGDSPALSGLKGAGTLACCWLLLVGGIGTITGTSPYTSFIATLEAGIDEALAHYRQNETVAPEAQIMLEGTLVQMKAILPIVMPAIILSCTLFSTWLTMVLGNKLAARFCGLRLWPRYRTWRLPDKLVWLGIGGAAASFLPLGILRYAAINTVILLCTVYCFQGFAICVSYMNKWKVPLLLRSFLYVMIVFQSFGTILLLVLGVFDIWFDFRKISKSGSNSGNTSTKDNENRNFHSKD